MILFTITTLAADPVQFDASSGGAALFAAAGVDATTASFDATMDFVMEFAMALEPLPPIKKAKLVRRIRQALAKHKTEL